jgi:DNA ligase-1
MQLDDLAVGFEQLKRTRSRLKMCEIPGTFVNDASPEETAIIAYLCEGRLEPSYADVEIGVGERMVMSAIAQASRVSSREVEKLFREWETSAMSLRIWLARRKAMSLS